MDKNIKKPVRPINILFTKDPSQNERYTKIESKGIEKIFHANENQK